MKETPYSVWSNSTANAADEKAWPPIRENSSSLKVLDTIPSYSVLIACLRLQEVCQLEWDLLPRLVDGGHRHHPIPMPSSTNELHIPVVTTRTRTHNLICLQPSNVNADSSRHTSSNGRYKCTGHNVHTPRGLMTPSFSMLSNCYCICSWDRSR